MSEDCWRLEGIRFSQHVDAFSVNDFDLLPNYFFARIDGGSRASDLPCSKTSTKKPFLRNNVRSFA
jgi:hypothetical protein